ncbi:hypothetical protein C1645_822764 [Glomus cerebriforme]|uniref:Reverse transcriptase domain-containing protein n=1 Tax=Glomus cerebriforme TaxID=658196 RepID=A0A397T7C3_9GLOM|nr:hypothetical protein C1645_822764 [Glomus cerebriforme]
MEFYIQRRITDLMDNQRRMINSLLNRTPKIITLDKLQYVDDNQETIFTTDHNTIEHLAISHYQTLGNPNANQINNFTNTSDLPQNWQHIFQLADHVRSQWFNNITNPITELEFNNIIHTCPINKAAGKSKIKYEDIKHAHSSLKLLIIKFFNNILNSQIYPTAWFQALLFPIPKPKPFKGLLNNTRPIILLETLRKIFVKIISTRLNNILSHHPILQFNNRASL